MIFAVSVHSGCSALFVSGPPANHAQMATFECSESNAWPVIDAIWAGLNGIGAASAAGDDTNPNQAQIVAVGLSWLAVSGISAIYGFSKVSQCHDAKRQRDERFYGAPAPTPAPVLATPAAPGAAPPPGAVVPAAPVRAAPAAAPMPPAAPAPTSGTTPSLPMAPASTSPAPTTSLSPSRSRLPVHLAVRSLPSRSLTMRPALATN
jgi:hypothetical protein